MPPAALPPLLPPQLTPPTRSPADNQGSTIRKTGASRSRLADGNLLKNDKITAHLSPIALNKADMRSTATLRHPDLNQLGTDIQLKTTVTLEPNQWNILTFKFSGKTISIRMPALSELTDTEKEMLGANNTIEVTVNFHSQDGFVLKTEPGGTKTQKNRKGTLVGLFNQSTIDSSNPDSLNNKFKILPNDTMGATKPSGSMPASAAPARATSTPGTHVSAELTPGTHLSAELTPGTSFSSDNGAGVFPPLWVTD